MAQALSEGRAKLMSEDPRATYGDTPKPVVPPFNHAPEADQKEALRRRKYVVAMAELKTRSYDRDICRKAAEVAEQIGDQHIPAARTIREWRSRYERAGGKIEALLPQHARKGNRHARFPAKVYLLAEKAIRDEYAIEERPTLVQAHAYFTELIRDENQGRLEEVRLPSPSYNAFRNIVRSFDAYDLAAKRHGKRAAKIAYGRTDVGLQMSFPLERVEVDHQKLDLLVKTAHLGFADCRPYLTVAIDHYSRACVGYVLSFSTGIETVLTCLRRSIILEPHRYDDDGVLLTEESWDCYGVPLAFGFDNGPEFHSTAVTHALYQIGAGAEYTRAYTPEHKGIVERFFGTVSVQFCRGLPGFTFSDPKERGDYAAHTKAALKFEEVEENLYRWIVDVYNRMPNSTTGEAPIERFRRGSKDRPVRPVNHSDLVPFYGRTEERAITNQGVRINNRFYQAAALTEIVASQEYKTNGKKVTVYASNEDKDQIWVRNPVTGKDVEARWAQQAAPELTVEEKERAAESKKKSRSSLANMRTKMRQKAMKNNKTKTKDSKTEKVRTEQSSKSTGNDSMFAEGGSHHREDVLGRIEVEDSDLDLDW